MEVSSSNKVNFYATNDYLRIGVGLMTLHRKSRLWSTCGEKCLWNADLRWWLYGSVSHEAVRDEIVNNAKALEQRRKKNNPDSSCFAGVYPLLPYRPFQEKGGMTIDFVVSSGRVTIRSCRLSSQNGCSYEKVYQFWATSDTFVILVYFDLHLPLNFEILYEV